MKINRAGVKPYNCKSPRQCGIVNAALRKTTSLEASPSLKTIKSTMGHENSDSIQSTEVKQLHAHESQSYEMVSRWGQFLTSMVDDTSQSEGE